MLQLIKRVIRYDWRYGAISQTFFYKFFRKFYAKFASRMYGNPSKDFFVVGVTGTNGKTSTSLLIHAIFNKLVGKALVVTTEGVYIGEERIKMKKKMTSYDPFTLQKLIETAKANGCKIAIIEVSSHGIDQYRFEGVEFDMAVLTNLAPEHLDYHGSMAHYADTKKKLFKRVLHNTKNNKLAVFPKDDKYGRDRSESMAFDRALTFGAKTSSALKASNIQLSPTGTTFDLDYLGSSYPVSLKMLGDYNVLNVLAALSASMLVSIDLQEAIKVVSEFEGITGRLQQREHEGVRYFIDYAHNADGLAKSLTFLNSVKGTGKLFLMFGLPGERGDVQMPLGGEHADQLADFVVLTEDDSGGDNRLEIMQKIMSGMKREEGQDFFVIPERGFAMDFVVDKAKAGDLVLFAGQGHQKNFYSYYGTRKWNDMEELEKRINKGAEG